MSDIHFVQVKGADERTLDFVAKEMSGLETADNIVVVDSTVAPMNKEELKLYLEQLADAVDMELVEK